MRSSSVVALCIVLPMLSFSQQSLARIVPPKHEVRAVWITTVLGLDWPKSQNPQEQQQSLLKIVEKLHEAHFNTIFFQVRGRADAMYRSTFEPWPQQLTGTLGRDPGWDPLAFLLSEAHARGMEVHAWFNTMLAQSGGGTPSRPQSFHVIELHPEWVKEIDGEYWFDPGIPAVRKYLLQVAMDVVRHYDIDGMHFDYIRYPQKPFPDKTTYKRYGRGMQKDEWRRENINAFVRAFHDSALAEKPMLKIGSAPIGIYANTGGMRGLQGYSELYQDSRKWIREGWQDYLAPQVYWPLDGRNHDPGFASLASEWVGNSSGKHVYIGIGAYKPEVFSQIPVLIDSSRAIGANGNGFFRWENIGASLDVGGRYQTTALIPPMPWKDSVPPEIPRNVTVASIADGFFHLQWMPPLPAQDGDGAKMYAIYRSTTAPLDIGNAENLLTTLPGSSLEFTDTITHPQTTKYFYAVTALDKANNESAPAVESVVLPEIAELSRHFSLALALGETYPNPASSVVFIPYEIQRSAPVIVKILDRNNKEVVDVVDSIQKPGRYVAAADISKLEDGTYTCLLVAGDQTIRKTLRIDN